MNVICRMFFIGMIIVGNTLCEDPIYSTLMYAIENNNIETVKDILVSGIGATLNSKFLFLSIPNTNLTIAKLILSSSNIGTIKESAAQIFLLAENDPQRQRGIEIMQLISHFLNKNQLKKISLTALSSYQDRNLADFITWLQSGASISKLSDEDAVKYAAVAFTIPSCKDELKKLIPLLSKKDYADIITKTTIQDAFMTKNLAAFEILIPKIVAHSNNTLIALVKDELAKYLNNKINNHPQEFVDQIDSILNEEQRKQKGYQTTKFKETAIITKNK